MCSIVYYTVLSHEMQTIIWPSHIFITTKCLGKNWYPTSNLSVAFLSCWHWFLQEQCTSQCWQVNLGPPAFVLVVYWLAVFFWSPSSASKRFSSSIFPRVWQYFDRFIFPSKPGLLTSLGVVRFWQIRFDQWCHEELFRMRL